MAIDIELRHAALLLLGVSVAWFAAALYTGNEQWETISVLYVAVLTVIAAVAYNLEHQWIRIT